MRYLLLSLLAWFACGGCAYRIGQGVVAGALDEVHGDGRTGGLTETTDQLLEAAVLAELGHQLGQGLAAGATDIDPEQQAKLERTIEDLLMVAAKKTGKGLRTEVSPELRELVQKDIVRALADGFRGELGDSMEATVDRVIATAVSSLRTSLEEEQLALALSDLLRNAVYQAMREGQKRPAIGETLQKTLVENMLQPIESTVGSLTEVVADRVDDSARRTENTLRGVIGALVVVTSVVAMLYFIRNRQVRRLQEQTSHAERGLRTLDAALEHLDEGTRRLILAKLEEYNAVNPNEPFTPRIVHSSTPVPGRSDEYKRRG